MNEPTPIADELNHLLSIGQVDALVRQSLEQLSSKIAELEVESVRLKQSNAELQIAYAQASSEIVELQSAIRATPVESAPIERVVTEPSRESITLLAWLAKRKSETLAAISFGLQLDKQRALLLLDELESLKFIRKLTVHPEPNRYLITDLGGNLLERAN